jgi:hypothetical protein
VPERGGSLGLHWPITPVLADQTVLPDSKPGLPSFWPGLPQPPAEVTVSVNGVVCVAELPVPVMVTV